MKGAFVEMYQKISQKERKRFIQYVESPFFNQNKKVQALIQALERQFKSKKALDKKKVYQDCFGAETFNSSKYDNLISDLLQLWYGFLTQLRLQAEPTLQKQLLIRYLIDQEWLEPCGLQLERLAQIQKNNPWQDVHYWHAEYPFQELQDQQLVIQNQRTYNPHLQLRSNALDRYYHLEKMRIACDMASRNTAVNADYHCQFIEEIIQWYHLHPEELESFWALKIYLAAYQLFTIPDNELAYQELKNLLENHIKVIPGDELRHLYTYVLNYAVKRSNSGIAHFYQELFELYKLLLQESILFKNGILTQWTFTNIITTGIRSGNYSWTEQFIQSNEHYLLPDVRHNVVAYNLANLYFEKKDYTSALRMLNDVEFTDAFYHLSAKFIQLKSYFILAETEALLSLLHTTRRFLQRNRQLSAYQKTSSLNFLSLLQRLCQLSHLGISIRDAGAYRKKWLHDLAKTNPLANKKWLEEMAGIG